MTGEHLFSKSLLGNSASIRGMSWCPDDFKTIGPAALTIRSLCQAHNNALSPCDEEACRLAALLDWMMSDFLPPDGLDRIERLDGHLLTRWLCKTACNVAAAGNRPPPARFVRHAFSAADDPAVHVHAAMFADDRITLNNAHHAIDWLGHKTDPDGAIVVFLFRGMAWIIGTHPIDRAVGHIADMVASHGLTIANLVGRPTEMGVDKLVPGLGVCRAGRVIVRWSEPPYADGRGQ